MNSPLELMVTVDNSNGSLRDANQLRPRTINLLFDWLPPSFGRTDGSFRVLAYGSAIPDDGGGPRIGYTDYGRIEAYAAITQLRSTWQQRVIEYRTESNYPFCSWDLSARADSVHLSAVGLDLARAGRRLFTFLFRRGDEGLRTIGDLVDTALRCGEQIVEIHSDHLFAPWSMLYTPPEPDMTVLAADSSWSLAGFWGFKHLVQHTVRRHPGWAPVIVAPPGRLPVGLQVDSRIDSDLRTNKARYIATLVELFTGCSEAVVRTRKDELAKAVQSPDFRDKLMLFACHGQVSGDGTAVTQASLILSDDDPILTTDLIEWLDNQPFSSNPVVFIGACQGGQMSSLFYDAFGLELLKAGVNCVIGPQVDLPLPFATEYSKRLLTAFLEGARLGDAVRCLARDCASLRGNPLGLIFSLYRGLDTRLNDERP